jgi:hypothetical protein
VIGRQRGVENHRAKLDHDNARARTEAFDLEHFPAKWEPVRRPEMRQLKEIERFRDSTQTESALEHFQAKWEPVRRPEMRQLKEMERFRDSTQTESALAVLPWAPRFDVSRLCAGGGAP